MKKSYFYTAFFTIVLATIFFFAMKEFLPKRIFPENVQLTDNVAVDSLMLEAIAQSDSLETEKISKKIVKDTINKLSNFFEKLEALEATGEGKIRIGYFGDSMTDGDLIVQDLRQLFQNWLGGQGVGFVPITSESAGSRASVRHSFSSTWKTQSYLNVKNPTKPFGVSGQVFFAKNAQNSWVKYDAPYKKELPSPVLFFGKSGNKDASVEISFSGDTTKIKQPLHTDKLLNIIHLADKNISGVKLNFIKADSIPIYGINFDSENGVFVDNFSSRGNSGLPLSLLNPDLMHEFDRELGGYDLIVLHFGANVLNYGSLNYGWYEKGMQKAINQLRNCFPEASFLVISTADKSTKTGTQMKTDKAVVPLCNAQEQYAQKSYAGFINLYTLMGGEGSMKQWTEANPPLASKDYTHFNANGAKKVAHLIYGELQKKYKKHKEKKDFQKIASDSLKPQNDTISERKNQKKDSLEIDF